jgi:hypothetical protein
MIGIAKKLEGALRGVRRSSRRTREKKKELTGAAIEVVRTAPGTTHGRRVARSSRRA